MLTKLAVISDVHGNLEALEEVLRQVRGMPIYCLGDLVDYGANPEEVIQRIREDAKLVLVGNHDRAALTGDTSFFNAKAAMSSIWTRRHLTSASVDFLRGLPAEHRFESDGVKSYVTHGSPDDNMWEYVYLETHKLLFGHYLKKLGVSLIGLGHTHVPFVWEGEEGVVFNPGSVGQPRDGDWRASYAILETGKKGINVDVRRVEYDRATAAAKIREAGLPAVFAEILLAGD